MTNQFPGTFPVIADGTGRLYGYVLQAPADPDIHVVNAVTWTYAHAATGQVSASRHISRRIAVLSLLAECGVAAPDLLTVVDLDLMGVLHGLSERYTGREILRAALDYAVSRHTLPVGEVDDETPARRDDPAPMDRALVHHVITGQIGPWTADDVFALYDKVAPERVPLAAVTD